MKVMIMHNIRCQIAQGMSMKIVAMNLKLHYLVDGKNLANNEL